MIFLAVLYMHYLTVFTHTSLAVRASHLELFVTLVLIIIEIIDSKYQLLHACGKRVMKNIGMCRDTTNFAVESAI